MSAHGTSLTMRPSPQKTASVREDLLLHSRYIRDTLVPLVAKQPKLSHSDSICLRSIFKTLDVVPMTLELLRYSRIEKALIVIAAPGNAYWPMDILDRAEGLISKWEDKLGPLKNLRADLYGPGGRMEGVRKITWKDGTVPDDEVKSAWSVEGAPEPSRAHGFGHLGFEVGDWWLKPAAAYRDGIIDETSHGITADETAAYAIVLTGNCETETGRERDIRYQAEVDDPGVFRLTKTMMREDPEEKVVRVLRSWKLKSKIAPKAGLRYDGLYRLVSFSVHLSPPNTWHTAFNLSRIPNQPSLLPALHIPTSDQLDDWKDYQRLKLMDRGDDFAKLHEILTQPPGEGDNYILKDARQGSEDSGYYSKRSSWAMSAGGSGGARRESGLTDEKSTIPEGIEREDEKNSDDEAEEADDEGAGLEDVEEEDEEDMEDNDDDDLKAERTVTPRHPNPPLPQIRIETRFISPHRPAEPHLSRDEAVVDGRDRLGRGEKME